jgi:hypothetical protein
MQREFTGLAKRRLDDPIGSRHHRTCYRHRRDVGKNESDSATAEFQFGGCCSKAKLASPIMRSQLRRNGKRGRVSGTADWELREPTTQLEFDVVHVAGASPRSLNAAWPCLGTLGVARSAPVAHRFGARGNRHSRNFVWFRDRGGLARLLCLDDLARRCVQLYQEQR